MILHLKKITLASMVSRFLRTVVNAGRVTRWEDIAEVHSRAIKRDEGLILATTWMNLENVLLSQRSQSQKATYCMRQEKR